MPLYTYRVKNESGKIFTGEAKVDKESDLTSLLIERGYTPVEIKEKNALTDISQISIFKKRVKIKDLAVFCRQFSIVLEAGVPIATCLEVLRDQTTNPTLKRCVGDVSEDIKKGISLSTSMKKQTEVFPEILINMVESGEVSGQLERVFGRMAEDFEKQFKLNQKIKSALIYPAIVSVVAIGVIIILLAFVIPTFTTVLKGLKADLPTITKVVVNLSNFFKSWWWMIIVCVIGIVVLFRIYYKSESGKRTIGSLLIKLPVVKNVTKNIMTARLTRTLGSLIASGVLLIQSMEVVQKVVGNAIIAEKLEEVIGEIKKGRGLTQPLANLKYFPPLVISMVRIGEESGDLDFSLNKCADFYDEEVELSMQQLTALVEPAIIIVLAVVVGFIMLSVLYPMISVYSNMAANG